MMDYDIAYDRYQATLWISGNIMYHATDELFESALTAELESLQAFARASRKEARNA